MYNYVTQKPNHLSEEQMTHFHHFEKENINNHMTQQNEKPKISGLFSHSPSPTKKGSLNINNHSSKVSIRRLNSREVRDMVMGQWKSPQKLQLKAVI